MLEVHLFQPQSCTVQARAGSDPTEPDPRALLPGDPGPGAAPLSYLHQYRLASGWLPKVAGHLTDIWSCTAKTTPAICAK